MSDIRDAIEDGGEMLRTWRHPASRRHYRAHLTQDLFGDWVLVRAWGTLDRPSGTVVREVLSGYGAGLSALERIARRRASLGFVPV